MVGILPDLDGLGLVSDLVTHGKTEWFAQYHHLLCHNLLFGLLLSATPILLVKARRLRVFLLSLAAFHLHLLGDLMGSRGPDGYQWPIPYLWPFSPSFELTWHGQWNFNGWQNSLILAALFAWAVCLAFRRHRSFVEIISRDLDRQILGFLSRGRWA